MGWSHPDISMADLVVQIKGFVDILVLASGYQSSGLPAIWDVDNIKKAVRWGLFFENVLKSLELYGKYEESVKELDAVLFNLTSDPLFPLGLAHMTSATLSNARRIVLEYLLQTYPIKDEHFVAFLRAVVELDLDELTESRNDCQKVYIERLALQMDSLELAGAGMGLKKVTTALLPENDRNTSKSLNQLDKNLHTHLMFNDEMRGGVGADTSFFVIREILSRQAVMSHMSLIEKGINGLSEIVAGNKIGSENTKFEWKSANGASSDGDQILMELNQFNQWRSRCVSYLLDKRTTKLLSGAELIFQAPKDQWSRIFEGLMFSTDPYYDNVIEIMELLLLGLISSKWNSLIQKLISLPCDFLPIPKKLLDLHELLQRYNSAHSNKPYTGKCWEGFKGDGRVMKEDLYKIIYHFHLRNLFTISLTDLSTHVSLHLQTTSAQKFNGLNFSEWREQVQFHLGVLDLDLALTTKKPPAPTNLSSDEQKSFYKT
ncbi:uncharacterized protein LOC110019815 [Phalaenopsis equestris]|uniref:uncharacterized protein LOC110019815 n=1 Tax=Phalaenopsis equestris TaxID=78828 RepID=UPI0009E5A2BD|nr:uncharacterized protein LOC110019815 [Phalaenopsis equestris]